MKKTDILKQWDCEVLEKSEWEIRLKRKQRKRGKREIKTF
jgi:hypothetical protein